MKEAIGSSWKGQRSNPLRSRRYSVRSRNAYNRPLKSACYERGFFPMHLKRSQHFFRFWQGFLRKHPWCQGRILPAVYCEKSCTNIPPLFAPQFPSDFCFRWVRKDQGSPCIDLCHYKALLSRSLSRSLFRLLFRFHSRMFFVPLLLQKQELLIERLTINSQA